MTFSWEASSEATFSPNPGFQTSKLAALILSCLTISNSFHVFGPPRRCECDHACRDPLPPRIPSQRGGPTARHLSPLLSSPQAYADTTAHAALSSAFQRPEKANKGLLRMATITF